MSSAPHTGKTFAEVEKMKENLLKTAAGCDLKEYTEIYGYHVNPLFGDEYVADNDGYGVSVGNVFDLRDDGDFDTRLRVRVQITPETTPEQVLILLEKITEAWRDRVSPFFLDARGD